MYWKQAEWLIGRKAQPGHKSDIRHAHNNQIGMMGTLIRRVFDPGPIEAYDDCTPFVDPQNPDFIEDREVPTRLFIASKLYDENFADLKFRMDSGYGREVSEKELFETLFLKKHSCGKNSINYLVGDVGIGKTATINYLKWKYRESIKAMNSFVVHLELDKTTMRSMNPGPIFYSIYCNLENVFNKYNMLPSHAYEQELSKRQLPGGHAFRSSTPSESNDMAADDDIYWLNKTYDYIKMIVEKTGYRPVFVIDNIDYIVHSHDRSIFSRDYNEMYTKLIGLLQRLLVRIYGFEHSDFGSLNLNIVIVIRKETRDYIVQADTNRGTNARVEALSNFYYIETPSKNDVLQGRKDLFLQCIQLINKYSKEDITGLHDVYMALSDIITDGHVNVEKMSTREVIATLIGLSKEFLREVMNHFSLYSWVDLNDYTVGTNQVTMNLSDRFIGQFTPSQIAFITGGKRLYSQFESGFPNIYLVDNSIMDDKSVTNRLRRPHAHSYWLKRFIFEYVAKKSHQRLSKQHVISTFCNGNPDESYEQHLVELLLGSLSHVDSSCMIRPVLDQAPGCRGLEVSDIELSHRGRHIHEKKFLDSFTYLQLLVDDHNLSFPEPLLETFKYPSKDYGYLIAPTPTEYRNDARRMIVLKAWKVIYFMTLLERCYQIESERFPYAFDAMSATISIDFDLKFDKLFKELNSIAEHFNVRLKTYTFKKYANTKIDACYEELKNVYYYKDTSSYNASDDSFA